MFGFSFLGKTHIPHNKNTADFVPVKMLPAKDVVIPMSQHLGAPATPVVKVGDQVKVGQLIAEASGFVSSAVHSPVSGKVTKIETCLLHDGKEVPAIRIESDGQMTISEDVKPPVIEDFDSFIAAVRASGLVGLGGAGFPASVKLDGIRRGTVHTILINGAECEPYITSDTRTMLDQPQAIVDGIAILEKFVPEAEKIVFGIEKNKPECIAMMNELFKDNSKVSVCPLPTLYPQGAEKVLIYNTTRLVVPEGKFPVDVGVIVMNVTSLAVLGNYVKTGMPLIEKCITVDGSAVKKPMNVVVPLGVSIREVLEFVGVDFENVGKVLFGGPMMGHAACSLDEPITKRNNALTVMSVEDSVEREATACIHCGRCVADCPMGLNPTAFAKALKLGTEDMVAKLEEYRINLCMECGCCSYVCPANRPLVQNNRLAKVALRDYNAHKSTLK